MPKPQNDANRHRLRVWIKLALETGLFEKLPPQLKLDGFSEPRDATEYARGLMEELKDPGSGDRTLKEIVADARRYRAWVEERQKDCVRQILMGPQPGDSARRARLMNRAPVAHDERRPTSREIPKNEPALHPLWDKWVDSFES